MRVESAGSDGGLQRANVNVKFFGQLAERKQFRLLRVMFDRRSSPQEHGRRKATSGVPGR